MAELGHGAVAGGERAQEGEHGIAADAMALRQFVDQAASFGGRFHHYRRSWPCRPSEQREQDTHQLVPHRVRTFKLSKDPKFAEKVQEIVGLYNDPPMHAVVLSVDEKSAMCGWPPARKGLVEHLCGWLPAVMCPASFAADKDRRP